MTESKDTGRLRVELATGSGFLGSTLPVEVRNSSLKLVARGTTRTPIDLRGGLYEVSTVLGDGLRHRTYVQVEPGADTSVMLGHDTGNPADEAATYDLPTRTEIDLVGGKGGAPAIAGPAEGAGRLLEGLGPSSPRPSIELGGGGGADSIGAGAGEPTVVEAASTAEAAGATEEAAPELEILHLEGAVVTRQHRGSVLVRCADAINEVPTATVRIAGREQRISLPISPQRWTPSGMCVLVPERTGTGWHVQAWIERDRKVARALQNMFAQGHLLEGAELAGRATDLLREKYDDPAGAALGALLLYKVGQLQRYESWVSNLAGSFPWLPDGAVLAIKLRADRRSAEPADLERLLALAARHPLYAETFSLLLDLLRRWPGGRDDGAHAAALAQLADMAPDLDREAVCFGVWTGEAAG